MSLPMLRMMAIGSDRAAASGAALVGASLSDSALTPANASVGYRISNDGDEYTKPNDAAAYGSINTWLVSGVVADYECLLTVNSGDTPGTTAVDTWLSCDTDRTWTLSQTTVGSKVTEATVFIRSASTQIVITSAVVEFDVQVDSE